MAVRRVDRTGAGDPDHFLGDAIAPSPPPETIVSKRKHIPLKNKLAACLLTIGQIDYQKSKTMTAADILAMFEWDHWPVRVADADGSFDINAPWNLKPRIIEVHLEKTKRDLGEIAKRKRIVSREATHTAAMAAKHTPVEPERVTRTKFKDMKRKIANRPFPKVKRKLRSRGFR
jgi:hypothetical protein